RAARANPWIAAAEVHRILPNTITVDVREYAAAAVVELGDLYLVDASGRPLYLANRAAAAATVRAAIAAFERWRAAHRPAIREIHIDPHGAITLHSDTPAIAIQLGPLGGDLDARMRTFDTAWIALSDAERARARAIHLGARSDHITVAFATD